MFLIIKQLLSSIWCVYGGGSFTSAKQFRKFASDTIIWVLLCWVTHSWPTLCNPMDCNPPGSSVHGIFQARMLEQVTILSARGSSCLLYQQMDSLTTAPLGKPFLILQVIFQSLQFSWSVISNYLQPHGLQHTRPLCPSPTPRVYSNSCPLCQ